VVEPEQSSDLESPRAQDDNSFRDSGVTINLEPGRERLPFFSEAAQREYDRTTSAFYRELAVTAGSRARLRHHTSQFEVAASDVVEAGESLWSMRRNRRSAVLSSIGGVALGSGISTAVSYGLADAPSIWWGAAGLA
jgi:hypothetical protein